MHQFNLIYTQQKYFCPFQNALMTIQYINTTLVPSSGRFVKHLTRT